ncbi:MAG: hypothetical protein UY95_C0004G0015 [Parcubacteria group bacterium GW2011_GWA2_56_7]|nr:MAG: hypothetical protein UY95_C0004G0015 [Parcubacteria group bacterium GW2011_GWA2_56_7]
MNKLPPARTILKEEYARAKQSFRAFLPYVVPLALFLIVLMGLSGLMETDQKSVLSYYVVVEVLFILYSLYVTVVLPRLAFGILNGHQPGREALHHKLLWTIVLYLGLGVVMLAVLGVSALFFLFPAVILGTLYFAATFELVIEGKGVHESLASSVRMIAGRKWNTFATLFLCVLGVVVPLYIVYGVAFMIFRGILGDGPAMMWLLSVVYGLLFLLITPWLQMVYVRVYKELRA